MRHRVFKKHFNRSTKHRKSMLKNLVKSLVLHGKVITTLPKAKELKRIVDKLMAKAVKGDVHNRRLIHRFLGDGRYVNVMVDRIAVNMKDKTGGFTTISKLGIRRGDSSEMAKLEFTVMPEVVGTLKKIEKKQVKKTTKKA